MGNNIKYGSFLFAFALLCFSCRTTNVVKYYEHNHQTLDSIEASYKQQYKQNRFSVEFTDKTFKNVSLELFTDTIKYIYEFGIDEARMNDSLNKYHISPAGIHHLIEKMRSIKCTWINSLDYYINGKKDLMIYLSIRPRLITFPLTQKKYLILTYYSQAQYYDTEGRLLDRRKRKSLRKINGEIYRRITDRVAYTVSVNFR
jgi:hypothetical protein